jgi:hypothetical protein
MFKQHFVLMAPIGEEGGDFGGLDRGDDVIPPSTIDDTPVDGEKDEAAAAEAAAAEELAAKAAAKADETTDEDEEGDDKPPRDEKTGKFAKKDKEERIPKSRFDDAVNKERQAREAAEGKLAELQKQLSTVDRNADNEKLETEIKTLEQQHTKLMLDGEAEKAAAVMSEIRMKERQIGITSNAALTEQAKEQAREEMRMELTVERLEGTYDEFNPNHEKFDEGLVEMVVALQIRKINQGLSPSKALVAAATEVMTRISSDGGKGDKETKGLAAAAKGADRKAEQVSKNLDAAKRQPASTKPVGKDSDKAGETLPTVSGMTMAEFAALPESTKSKLRGDTV